MSKKNVMKKIKMKTETVNPSIGRSNVLNVKMKTKKIQKAQRKAKIVKKKVKVQSVG